MSVDPQAHTETEATAAPQPELEAALQRESELRAALIEAHGQRLATEDRLAGRVDAALVEVEALRDQLAKADARALAARVRFERLEQSLPMRVLKPVASLPVLRARRARNFERALERAQGKDG